jgi:hypothetical protein
MSEKFKNWAKNLGDDIKRDIAEFAANEATRARDDIRQKVIQEGWTGQHSAFEAHGTSATTRNDIEAPEPAADNVYSTIEHEEFNGTVWDNEASQEMGDSGIEAPEIEAPQIEEPDIDEPEIEP